MPTDLFDISNLRAKNYYSLIFSMVEYLRTNKFRPGDRLPQETVLATHFHTNRSTLREMLRVLEVMGIIDSKRGSGNIFLGNMEIGFMNMFLLGSFLYDGKPYEFGHLRAIIEVEAIASFLENASDADIYKLEIIYTDQMEHIQDKNSKEYLDGHLKFHNHLMKYYNSEAGKQIVRSNLRLMQRDYESVLMNDNTIGSARKAEIMEKMSANCHAAILNAVKKRDVMLSKQLMMNHALMSSRRDVD